MKSNWRVSSNIIAGHTFYGIYRLIDVSDVDHSGNRETYGGYWERLEEAEALAERKNKEERQKWESTIKRK